MADYDFYGHEAKELELYIENDYAIHKGWLVPTSRRLAKLHTSGQFDREKGLRAMRRVCDNAAKQYTLEHGSMTTKWSELFTKGDRDRVSGVLVDNFLTALRDPEPYWL
jgi:hypothetical protein